MKSVIRMIMPGIMLLCFFLRSAAAAGDSGDIHPGNCRSFTRTGNVFVFHCTNGSKVSVKVCSREVIKISYAPSGSFKRNNASFAVIKEDLETISAGTVQMQEQRQTYEIHTGKIQIRIGKRPFRLDLFDKDGKLIVGDFKDSGLIREKDTAKIISYKTLRPDEQFFGLGEKAGPLNRRGRTYKMWNSDQPCYGPDQDPLYKSIPFFLSSYRYGIFFDNTYKSEFIFGKRSADGGPATSGADNSGPDNSFSFGAAGGELVYYILAGKDYKDILEKYKQLTGSPIMPPKWALGFSQCRGLYTREDQARNIAAEFRKRKIPCDIIYQDIGWTDGLQNFSWRKRNYTDPKGMLKTLDSLGFKMIVSQDPVISQATKEQWREADSLHFFTIDVRTGKSYDMPWPWGGNCGVVDFTNPAVADWWGAYQQKPLNDGVRGFWTDMGEPAWSNEDAGDRLFMKHYAGMHEEIHNVYGLTWDKIVKEQFEKRNPGKRIFQMTRSAYAGLQRYTFGWSGDSGNGNDVLEGWDRLAGQIPVGLSAGMGLLPFWACDISGYCGDIKNYPAMAELYTRWLQFGVFNPLSRAHHEGDNAAEPWLFGKASEDACRAAIELKYQLFPYIYTYARVAHDKGLPLMRALLLEYPDDPEAVKADGEFLFGKELLVAPVVEKGAVTKKVYLPKGEWIGFKDGQFNGVQKYYTGGQWVTVDAPLSVTPLFVRRGSIIPMMPVMQFIHEQKSYPVALHIYPPALNEKASFELYEDDGESLGYQKGEFARTTFRCSTIKKDGYRFQILAKQGKGYSTPGPRNFLLEFHGMVKPGSVILSNPRQAKKHSVPILWTWNETTHTCTVTLPDTGKSTELEILPPIPDSAFFLKRSTGQPQASPIWYTQEFSLYRDSIVQQPGFVSHALSSTRLVSNYSSQGSTFKSSSISFKFCINGKDNEMLSGHDHLFSYIPGKNKSGNGYEETPLIVFGEQYVDTAIVPANVFLPVNAKWKVRLDMRQVFRAFHEKGFYTNFKGERIYQQDFRSVSIAGSSYPLIWVFDNIASYPELQVKDDDGDGIYEAIITLNPANPPGQNPGSWSLTKDISSFPQYHSDYPITDAVYNMALEEMQKAIEPDSTFRTGKEWAGVWTRDISYSILLSMARLQPRVARYSLLKKVNKNGKIIQDNGTGGAWPVSTDRLIWAVAAWELYQSTGDKDWLEQAYRIIKNSIEDDLPVIYDPLTGLVKGESSFLDWREQTYPKWMQPADIFESENLGTNAVHYQANNILAQMAVLLHDPATAAKHKIIAEKIKTGINQYMWMPEKGYYGQYLYGRGTKQLSPRSESLGEALTVIFNIADSGRKQQILGHTPVTAFGIPCIYPQIPGIPPYHNNAVWPFVQSFWLWAAAKTGNERSALESMADIYRPAGLFLTNKENFVADNGDYQGTQINSSNMLWSLSGNLSIVYSVLFGMEYRQDSLVFHPFVPKALAGKRTLTNFSYRNARLSISMEGYGNRIRSFSIDGKQTDQAALPGGLSGEHTIHILLASQPFPEAAIHKMADYTSPPTPELRLTGREIQWEPVAGAVSYRVFRNGKPVAGTQKISMAVPDTGYAVYQVEAVDTGHQASFLSEPVSFSTQEAALYQAEEYGQKESLEESLETSSVVCKGYTGSGFAEISTKRNTRMTIPVVMAKPGKYWIDFRYSNGNGPTNTENKCAIRTLKIDGLFIGSLVFPQRGKGEWSNWGFSNGLPVQLRAGKHFITLSFEPYNDNMNGEINQAMLDYLRVTRVE
ncbi:TIM-barrel domain-containing protein [Flavitalea flava]